MSGLRTHWSRAVGVAWRAMVLLVGGLAMAATANALSPSGVAWSDRSFEVTSQATAAGLELADVEKVQRLLAGGEFIFLDARPQEDFATGRLPGALSMPSEEMGEVFEQLQIVLIPEQPVLVYCSGEMCDESLQVGRFLKDQGVERVVLFAGGIEAWREAGLALESEGAF